VASLIKRQHWIVQPSSPIIAIGPRHFWGLDVIGAGPGLNSMFNSGRPIVPGIFGVGSPSTTTGNNWVSTSKGRVIKFDDAGTGTSSSKDILLGDASGSGAPAGNVFSILFNVYLPSQAQQGMYGSTGTINNGVEVRLTGGGNIELLKSGSVSIGTSSGTIPLNTWTAGAVTYDGTNASFYLQGAASGTASSAQTFNVSCQYGVCAREGSSNINGSMIGPLSVFDRVLTPGEIAIRAANWWYDLKPRLRRILISSGSAAAAYIPYVSPYPSLLAQ
jgi:hypothetical protein